MAAKADGNYPMVCKSLAASDRIPNLCADGLGHLGLAGAATGADAIVELGMGVAALGAQPDPAFIHIGTETNAPPERPRPDIDAKTTWMAQ